MFVGRNFHEYPSKSEECQFTILIDSSGISPPSQNSALVVLSNVTREQNLDTAEGNYAMSALNSTAAELNNVDGKQISDTADANYATAIQNSAVAE
jgi:hypothetical protein